MSSLDLLSNELDEEQRLFVSSFVLDFNFTATSRRTGISVPRCKKMHKLPVVEQAIDQVKSKIAEICDVTSAQVLNELKRIAFYDINEHVKHLNSSGVTFKELEELEPNTVATSRDSIINTRNFVNIVVPKVQFFENNKDKYSKKDLRQYIGDWFDRDFLDFTTDLMSKQSKKKESKDAKKDSIKLYEDDNILVVKPLTHKSSCYYGSGTK